jgi:protein TonB
MAGNKKSLRSRLPAIAGLLFLALFTAGVIWLVKGFIENAEPPEKTRVQKISLVKPPPPKPQEKLPEPEKMEQPKEEVVQLDAPPTPDQPQDEGPPPGEQLGLDADGGAGSDGFGLAARKGGRDITTLGGGGDRMAWFSKRISRQLEDELKRAKGLQGKEYQVIAQLWFDVGGGVTRVRFDKGSGNTELDEALRREMQGVTLREPLPEDLPQPVKLRVVSR